MEEFSSKSNTYHKAEINQVIAKRALQLNVQPSVFQALFLDSSEAGTACELKRHGFQEHNLHIPNLHPQVCNILKTVLPTANIYNGSLYDYLSTDCRNQYHLIYADYCCTLGGNTHTSPLVDIETMFQNGHVADRCLIAHTFSKRAYTSEAALHAEASLQKTLQHLALQHGFICRLHEKLVYGNMVFVLHSCYRLSIAQQSLSLTPESLFDPVSTFEGEYECSNGVFPDKKYRLGASQSAVKQYQLPKGSTVFVCSEMTTNDSSTFKQWFEGRVVRRVHRDEYMVDYLLDGIQSTFLRRKDYSTRQSAPAGSWFLVK